MTENELTSIRRLIKKWALTIIATVGLGGLATFAMAGARAWSAVLQVEQHEDRLRAMEMNNYLTCLMVKQLYNERMETVKMQLDIDLDCKKPEISR